MHLQIFFNLRVYELVPVSLNTTTKPTGIGYRVLRKTLVFAMVNHCFFCKLNSKIPCLLDLIIYVPSTIFQLCRDGLPGFGLPGFEPVLS